MRHLALCSLLGAAIVTAGAAQAGPPLAGSWTTTDLGGPVSIGHYTESWLAGGSANDAGTTLNAESWDGASLGLEWRYSCATELAAGILLVDTVNGSGFGNRTYMKTFVGGTIWLSGTGPWANGDTDYPGVIDSYKEFETIQYQNWQPVGAVTNVQATAHFDNYPADCLAFQVSNGVLVGSTDFGMTKPSGYPDFIAAGTCAPGLTLGAWWNMITMTLSIGQCTVSTEPADWSSMKTLYR